MVDSAPVVFSFFSGAGFLDLGFEEAGFQVAYVNEVHKPFIEAYKHSRKVMNRPSPIHGFFEEDIEECLNGNEKSKLAKHIKEEKRLNKLVGFIGGPPCPDFSVGGKNKGKDGENGKLTQTYIDLIVTHKPDFFVFENVKGLWRTARHRQFFEDLKHQLSMAGYSFREKLINALEYGAPQERERIILFGVKKTLLNTEEDIEKFDWIRHAPYANTNLKDFDWPQAQPLAKQRTRPKGVPLELTVQHWFDTNQVEKHPNATHQFKARAGLAKFQTVHEGDDSKKSYKRLHRWRYSPTAAYGNNEVHLHPYLPRRISVAEALAIQSLPANFELPKDMTLTNMFKTIGNGVPYLAALGLGRSVMDFLIEGIDETNRRQSSKSNLSTTQK